MVSRRRWTVVIGSAAIVGGLTGSLWLAALIGGFVFMVLWGTSRPLPTTTSRAWDETPREAVTRRSRYIEAETKLAVYRKSDGRCVVCGSREQLEVDHIIPWSKGGSNELPNLQVMCHEHNQAKSDRLRMPAYVETGD